MIARRQLSALQHGKVGLAAPLAKRLMSTHNLEAHAAALKLDDPTLLRTQAFIDGQWVDADNGGTVDVIDKATGAVIATVPDMGKAETKRAIEAATKAWGPWAAKTGKERSVIVRKWYELILQHENDLGRIMTAECGKPLAESIGEIRYGASFVDWFAEEAKRSYGEWIPPDRADNHIVVIKQPIGPVAAVTPWNFPSAMITRKVSPAIAVGCPVIIKPSELTPFSCLALIELGNRAGIPPGIFSAVVGSAANTPAIGEEMCTNPLVRKVAFTGSTAVGKKLMALAAGTVKKVALELGGNAPLIVFDDADVDVAIKGAMNSKFRNAGQTCVCANRIFVQEGIYEAFSKKLTEAVAAMKTGIGTEEGVVIGPLVNARAVDKVDRHVTDAVSKGATALCGGTRLPELGDGFYAPTVLGDMTPDMQLFSEETFGPVAAMFKFKTEEEVIQMANDTPYGLAGYFFTKDLRRAWRVSEQLEFGIIGVNEGIISTEVAPFGGVKESGLGREGSHHGTAEFCEPKYIRMGIGYK
jgi:succinate-semialdehyde dehydrogenase/glutarate-semialdehyde dehydrogenase